jgi:hypothetical protein
MLHRSCMFDAGGASGALFVHRCSSAASAAAWHLSCVVAQLLAARTCGAGFTPVFAKRLLPELHRISTNEKNVLSLYGVMQALHTSVQGH